MSAAPVARIVGCDPSLSSTGIACWTLTDDGPRLDAAETINTSVSRGASFTERAQRIKRIAREVEGWSRRNSTLLVIEGLGFSRAAQAGHSELAALWWSLLTRHVDYEGSVAIVSPTTVKKWSTGVGNSDKGAVAVVAARLCPGVAIPTSDVADALVLSLIGQQLAGWRDEPVAYRREALTKVAWADGDA